MVIDPKLLAMLGEESNIRIYPNPSSKQITIEYVLNEGEKGELLVYDIYGRERMKIDLSNTISRVSADISHLELGIYLYRYMINGKNSTTGKLIKE
ncbi:MAG: T9SS type A sorting domain-containing protein [Chitinophagaceae bacterium]|nr:T9SS type A sorting domain-containing protein [Chitinophagaceae bacterium]